MTSDWLQLGLGLVFLLVWALCSQIYLVDYLQRVDGSGSSEALGTPPTAATRPFPEPAAPRSHGMVA